MTAKGRMTNVITQSFCLIMLILGHYLGVGSSLGIGVLAGCLLYDSARLIWGE